jgi:peptidoglycan/xylan/chitin deacetylase (PgdA/CDA1 family)
MKSAAYTSRYAQVQAYMRANFLTNRRITSIMITDAIRDAALPLLGRFDQLTGRQEATLRRPRIQILNLHHVFEDEEDSFRQLLTRLAQTGHRFIGYSEAVERIWRGEFDAPYITFSFDDGLKSSLRAADIMAQFGAKACLFLSVSMIGETNPHKVAAFCAENYKMPPTEFLSWDDVETLVASGHEIGSHTMTHANLGHTSVDRIQDEVEQSFEVIKARAGTPWHFSWPLGTFADFSPQAARVVFESGFLSCASAVRGCHVATSEGRMLCLRRNHVALSWPLDHHLYYLSRQSQAASSRSNEWPEAWQPFLAEMS